ncbi:hypothetical protein [Streptomyces sp. CA-179760]|uniref:hypothetical protein n=1 Tax=Streptomyces sp. CA-179760 TaxID=3240054 RepID=UPI003D8E0A1A
MDSTATARRPLGNDAAPRPYAELTSGYSGHPPIYAALVAEWEARGHTVPEHRDGQWVSFAAPTESETWTAVPAWNTGPHLGPVVVPGSAHPAAVRHTGPVVPPAVHPAQSRYAGMVASSGLRPAADGHSGAPAAPAGARPAPGRQPRPADPPTTRLTSRQAPPAPR